MADLEHATENDTDLHGDANAQHWAERFAHRFPVILQDGEGARNDIEELMLTWFAGAIETGKMAVNYGQGTSLDVVVNECYELAISKGWGDPPPTFGEAIALLCAEACEALEAFRQWDTADQTAPNGTPFPGVINKPEGVGSEFADILIRLGHYCKLFGIDLQAEYDRKLEYNRTRPYRHGGKAL